MSIRSFFYDSNNSDRIYSSFDFSAFVFGMFQDGVIFDNDSDGLKVLADSPISDSVFVRLGKAFIQGRFCEVFTANEELTVPANATGLTRQDRVVFRVNFNDRIAELAYRTGTTSPPTLQRNANFWELSLAQLSVPNGFVTISQSDITDERNDLFLCGKCKPTTLRQNFQTVPASGWRRIAVTNGFFQTSEPQAFNRAFANFVLRTNNTTGGFFDQMNISAGAIDGEVVLAVNGRTRNVGGRNIDGVRLVFDPTFVDTRVALEVFIANSTTRSTFEIYDNYTGNGWFPINWTVGSLPGGFSECKLDFTVDDMVMGFATSDTITNAYVVLQDGTIQSSEAIILKNDQALRGEDTVGDPQDLIKMDTSDQVQLGNAVNTNVVPNTLIMSTNDRALQGVETGLTARDLIKLNASNQITLGNASSPLIFNSSTTIESFSSILLTTNNLSFRGEEVAGTSRNLIKMNASDQVEIGSSTNTNIFPNAFRISTNNKAIEGVETGGTSRQLIRMDGVNFVAFGDPNNVNSFNGALNRFLNVIRLDINNLALQGKETGGTNRNLLKLNASDQVEIGASTNENIMPSTLKFTTNNIGVQGVQTDGTTFRSLIKVNNFNNVEAGTVARPFFISSSVTPAFNDGVGVFDMFHEGYVQPQSRVTHSVLQTITTATDTALAFDTERWDSDTMHDNVTNNSRLTATSKGLYQINFNGEWEADAGATGFRRFSIRLNGTTLIASVQQDATTGLMRMEITTQYRLAATDFVEVLVHQTSGGDLDVTKNSEFSPEFSMSFISPTP